MINATCHMLLLTTLFSVNETRIYSVKNRVNFKVFMVGTINIIVLWL